MHRLNKDKEDMKIRSWLFCENYLLVILILGHLKFNFINDIMKLSQILLMVLEIKIFTSQ